MLSAPIPKDEVDRLRSLSHLNVLDTGPEAEFDAIVKVAALLCGTPISLISLITENRQWFKANVGLPGVSETPRELAFCAHAILQDQVFEVTDATKDARFADNPLVTENPNIRFYAGATLILSDGMHAGTLCVIDREPRQLSTSQREVLSNLALAAVQLLEGRRALQAEYELRQTAAKAIDDLVKSEKRLRELYQFTPAMLHSIDAQGRILSVSDLWLKTLGYNAEEVIGRLATDFLSDASKKHAQSIEARFFADGRCDDVAYQMVCKNGQSIDVQLSAVLERDADGQPLRSVAVVRNVTDLREAQRTTNALMHAISERYISSITNELGLITEVNDAFCHISGYSREELIGKDHRIVNSGLNGPGFFADMWATIQTGNSWRGEICNQTKNGQLYWVDSVVVPLPSANEQPSGYVSIRSDITARKLQEQALQKSKQLLNRTGEVAGVGGWELDLQTNTLVWSEQTHRIHAVPPGYEPSVTEAVQFYAPEARPVIQAAVELAMSSGQGWDLELPFVRSTGQHIWVRAVGSVDFENGQPVRLVGTLQDVTVNRKLIDELAEQHELLRVTLQSIGDAVITTDKHGYVTWLNPVAERMTGWLNAEAIGQPVGQVFHIVNEETRNPTENPVATCLAQGKVAGLANHTLLISRGGEEFGIEDSAAPIRNEVGEVLGVVLVFHDVTEQRRMSGEMSYRATHDALTGLINRSEFETRLRRVLNNAHENRSEHALLFIDLDQFKLVNDTCGHSVGDQLLQQVGKLLGETVRLRDTLARLGGDEFAVILEHCSAEQAQRVAQQICERMDDFRFVHDERRFRIGTSIGLVPLDNRWGTTAALMQAADTSCYAAKDAGRNRVHVWFDTDQAMRTRHGEMQWAARLEQALDENRFTLYAQRIDSLVKPNQAIHAEVLLRMFDSDGAIVAPGAFLPAAERFHFASRIDRWVLQRAIRCLKAMSNLSVVDTLCINLSGQSIGDRAFHRQALEILRDAGHDICQRICLEITETSAVMNMADARVFIDNVRTMGVRIALDDFGAGASSFGYLKNLKVDLLKIDGQFVRDIIEDPLDDAAVRCFVDVARVVGVKTVAEFVDREEIRAHVQALGIDYAQGFLLHRPEPIERVLNLSANDVQALIRG